MVRKEIARWREAHKKRRDSEMGDFPDGPARSGALQRKPKPLFKNRKERSHQEEYLTFQRASGKVVPDSEPTGASAMSQKGMNVNVLFLLAY